MRVLWVIVVLVLTVGSVGKGWAEDPIGARPLLSVSPKDLHSILPSNSHLLIDPFSIEQFLDALDGSPPDWGLVYGHGHLDPDHDERLFMLNRERDAKRSGNPVLAQIITFVWFGELSRYDEEAGGFRVALGPKRTPTRWGVVRFKYQYDDLQGDLVAKVSAPLRSELKQRLARGESVDITVAMTGRLIPEESVVYDFSHDQAGLGVIMPVVKVERLDYLLMKK
jgi:hypothetical protein